MKAKLPIFAECSLTGEQDPTKRKRYEEILDMINELPKYGNDIEEIDMLARDVAKYTQKRT